MENISKSNLIDAIAETTDKTKKDIKIIVDALIEQIKTELSKGNKVAINAFGTFEVRPRAARNGVNPATGEKITIAATNAVVFKVGKELKESVKH